MRMRSSTTLSQLSVQVDVTTHEIAHALGILHEMSRPDRDSYVSIDYNNIPVINS